MLSGDLTSATAPVLGERVQDLVNAGATEIQLDLGDVSAIDATGLAILVSTSRRFGAQGGAVVLRGLAPHLMKIFEVTGLVRYFQFV